MSNSVESVRERVVGGQEGHVWDVNCISVHSQMRDSKACCIGVSDKVCKEFCRHVVVVWLRITHLRLRLKEILSVHQISNMNRSVIYRDYSRVTSLDEWLVRSG